MRPLLLLGCGLLLAACSTVTPPAERGVGPYAAIPPPREPEPSARPITARLPYPARGADRELDAFLDRLTAAVERRNWRAVALFLDEDGYAARIGSLTGGGLSAERAAAETIAGALGLGVAGNEIYPAGGPRDERPFLGLDRVRTASIRSYALGIESGVYLVTGDGLMDDRTRRALEIRVRRTPRGYRVVVPQG